MDEDICPAVYSEELRYNIDATLAASEVIHQLLGSMNSIINAPTRETPIEIPTSYKQIADSNTSISISTYMMVRHTPGTVYARRSAALC